MVSFKGINIEWQYFVTHLPRHNQTTQTKLVQIIVLYANLCVIELFKLSLYQQSFHFKNLQTKEFSRLKNR